MLDVLLLIAKILFYSTCAAYIRSLYKDKEYVPHEEYHLLRNEYNRIVDYNKELKIKLQELDLQSGSISTSEMSHYIIDEGTIGEPRYKQYSSLRDMVLEGCSSQAIQERLNNCYLSKATSIRVVSSLADLYLTQDTGEIYVQVTKGNGNYLTGEE